jgi:ferredoxin
MSIRKVWIEDGCTMCGLCEEECPEAFELGSESSTIREDLELSENEEGIMNAVEACPVQVIHYVED